jgi:hypothetical protein
MATHGGTADEQSRAAEQRAQALNMPHRDALGASTMSNARRLKQVPREVQLIGEELVEQYKDDPSGLVNYVCGPNATGHFAEEFSFLVNLCYLSPAEKERCLSMRLGALYLSQAHQHTGVPTALFPVGDRVTVSPLLLQDLSSLYPAMKGREEDDTSEDDAPGAVTMEDDWGDTVSVNEDAHDYGEAEYYGEADSADGYASVEDDESVQGDTVDGKEAVDDATDAETREDASVDDDEVNEDDSVDEDTEIVQGDAIDDDDAVATRDSWC